MNDIDHLAGSLGRALGSTPEYRTLARAKVAADDDRRIVELTNELRKREGALTAAIQEGREPDRAEMERYEAALNQLQASSVYQSLVAAQANFDKIMHRVNTAIQKGMQAGAASRIVLA